MIAITIDCEQWNSPLLRGKNVEENNRTDFSKKGNLRLLDLLNKYDIKATFFVTGFFAEKEKDHVEGISNNHEIGCHGYNHFYRNNQNLNLNEDIKKAKLILERTIKKQIIGFRAPQMQYSINLIKILKEFDFKYDSSLHPACIPGFYNNKKFSINPFFPVKNVLEIPASVSPSLRLPISWVFMRNLGYRWTLKAVKKLDRLNYPIILYFHSWEFFEMKSKAVPYYIIRKTGQKFINMLKKLLKKTKEMSYCTMSEIYEKYGKDRI